MLRMRPGAMTRRLVLTEHQTRRVVRLTRAEREALQAALPGLAVTPSPGAAPGLFDLTPGSHVGALAVSLPPGGTPPGGTTPAGTAFGGPALIVEVRPKLPTEHVLFLASYALDPRAWRQPQVDLPAAGDLLEVVVHVFASHVRRALRTGLLHGYRPVEASLQIVRGRLRLDDQLNRHFGRTPPAEVSFDDFTPDVLENRLLRAAIHRLTRLPFRSPQAAAQVRRLLPAFVHVSEQSFVPAAVPGVIYTRLNEHYRLAVELARLILQVSSFDLASGEARVPALSFLLDMNRVFEDFVRAALREALGLSPRSFPAAGGGRALTLDAAGTLPLEPDLSWWEGGRSVFVGDVKYKQTSGGEHADLYQLLAYCSATDLPGGLLVYAAGPEADGQGQPASHEVRHAGKTLHVTALDLSVPPAGILAQIALLAQRIRRLRATALRAA